MCNFYIITKWDIFQGFSVTFHVKWQICPLRSKDVSSWLNSHHFTSLKIDIVSGGPVRILCIARGFNKARLLRSPLSWIEELSPPLFTPSIYLLIWAWTEKGTTATYYHFPLSIYCDDLLWDLFMKIVKFLTFLCFNLSCARSGLLLCCHDILLFACYFA